MAAAATGLALPSADFLFAVAVALGVVLIAGAVYAAFGLKVVLPGVPAVLSKAHALQAAQRSMLADPLLSHPAYWAPFLLIGNWL